MKSVSRNHSELAGYEVGLRDEENLRMTMYMLRGLALLLVGTCVASAQHPAKAFSAADPYSLDFVRSALPYFKNGGFGFDGKRIAWGTINSPGLNQFGDRVSIALLKIYSREELSQPENAGISLSAIRTAFENRNSVLEPSDREPRVTLFLLDYLQENERSDVKLEKRIEYIRGCIKEFACSPQGEQAFFVNH
jgi:hypothetical protein